jgi:hypothetical protein
MQIAHLSPPLFLGIWIALHCLHLVLIGVAHFRYTGDNTKVHVISALMAIPAIITLVLFVIVFVIGHASTDAQLTPRSTQDLWRLWVAGFAFNVFLVPFSILAAIANLFRAPGPRQSMTSVLARLTGVLASVVALFTLLRFMPTA